ncbi:WD40-repeat-containing domain protein [Halteromyces radiatus]|uniref:WD40-repeat-containing domain protein n=1 Tax=Halteromyces radiatus TaxID=101107 RepID=UPI002220E7BF|nr:WD40-repeat-containing domain protein [Halteromyces radiatus]KAI8100192.1 WD40-repeat-containing domain protein [Halteromyces radiatus]
MASNGNDWDSFAAMFPTSFGKKVNKNTNMSNFEKTKRQDVIKTSKDTSAVTTNSISTDLKQTKIEDETANDIKSKHKTDTNDNEKSDDDEEEEEEDMETNGSELPISHEVVLKGHTRVVSALALDPAGARLVTGGYDYDMKLWDFAGMDQTFRPFRSLQPFGDHQIRDIHYSLSGDVFLGVSGSAAIKLFNRDGIEQVEYIKGDPYIRDLRHTAGHVGALTSASWHPTDRQTFATASQDGTIRIWDVDQKRKQKQVIAYKSRERGGRSPATALAYTHDTKLIAGAFQDGSINLWSSNGPFIRPSIVFADAHQKHSETSSLLFSRDNFTMVSRGGDETVKVWDIRHTKKPVNTQYNLDIVNPEANVIFSPDERLILTGTACPKGQGHGKLVMMDRQTLEIRRTMHIGQSSVVKVLWHPRINQIVTGSADGNVHVFYSPEHSSRGVKMCVVKEQKKRAVDDYEINRPIITPHALPMFKTERVKSQKRKLSKLRKDPIASHRPDMPVGSHGVGGRVAHGQQHAIIKGLTKDTRRDEDPRAALLKYSTEAMGGDDQWVSNVYKHTQPNPVFASDDEEEEPETKKTKK